MRVIAKSTLKAFWSKHADTEQPLGAWYREAKKARWESTADIKAQYRSASIRPSGRVIFNIRGNRYRLVTHVLYAKEDFPGIVYVRFIGKHEDYDQVDVDNI